MQDVGFTDADVTAVVNAVTAKLDQVRRRVLGLVLVSGGIERHGPQVHDVATKFVRQGEERRQVQRPSPPSPPSLPGAGSTSW
ncbi:hypothetical protein AB0L53_49780 [Nonomuraea sp. NPDC052129]|uniref:hypothetical protein n=1 Tax=Nonomuraea sp. NPDC052129 TaxID=3154651 RepID=UPI003441B7F7